jgi:hypothetical protein
MSILEMTRTIMTNAASTPSTPYHSGDRIRAVDPEGSTYLGRVTDVQPTGDGHFTVLAELREPRNLRGHLLTAVVDVDGRGPGIEPIRR